MKNQIETPVEKLMVNEIPKKTWTHLIVDFITKLPLVVRKDIILVIYDKLSKIIYFVTTTKETLAERLVKLFRDNIWKLYKLSKSVISNKESTQQKFCLNEMIRSLKMNI